MKICCYHDTYSDVHKKFPTLEEDTIYVIFAHSTVTIPKGFSDQFVIVPCMCQFSSSKIPSTAYLGEPEERIPWVLDSDIKVIQRFSFFGGDIVEFTKTKAHVDFVFLNGKYKVRNSTLSASVLFYPAIFKTVGAFGLSNTVAFGVIDEWFEFDTELL